MAVTVRKQGGGTQSVADCAAGDVEGDIVQIIADEVAGIYQVSKLDITAAPGEHPLGMITQKFTSTRCVVQTGGEVRGLYAGLTPGKPLFVDLTSRLSHDVPARPASGIKWSHPVALALSNNAVMLRIQRPSILTAS